ncbi:hypothetical protein EV44_g3121 [Erysiphe necator]|uniref:Integrase catalytic domain-containing protein n=1 Tax=Uncinula necator TaxID=52586 RepID=A0A0B1NZ46_UNCNE|nr:hypothetical protein EV44_g3121 [Erysiphe necator]
MIDTGVAATPTAGYNQYLAYNKLSNVNHDISIAGQASIRFGVGSAVSIGSVMVHMPLGFVEFHVIKVDALFLMIIADLGRLGAYYNNVNDILVTKTLENLPVIRRFGHPFLLRKISPESLIQEHLATNTAFLTEIELRRLRKRFGHPSINRLRHILERSGHTDFDKNTIEKIRKFCHHCQLHSKSLSRFHFNLRDDISFNYTIIIDIMYIDGKEILHVIDEATCFQAAKWPNNVTAKHVWDTLKYCWIELYVGPPGFISHDAGLSFVSREFNQKASFMAITAISVPIEAHWPVRLVERCHHTLRRCYEIITEELNDSVTSKDMRLRMAVKLVNDSTGPNGLIPTLLVFGTFPRMCNLDPPSSDITKRASAIKSAMDEVISLRTKRKVAEAIGQRNSPSTTLVHNLTLGSKVLIFREGIAGRSGKWTSPFELLSIERETCIVKLPNGSTNFRSTVVKPYYSDNSNTVESIETTENKSLSTFNLDYSPPNIQNNIPTQRLRSPYNFRSKPLPNTFMISKILENRSSKFPNSVSQFKDARQKELNGLLEKGVFEMVSIDKVPIGIRIFNSRFVGQIKNAGTSKAFEKSRLVVQVYNDTDKKQYPYSGSDNTKN